MGSQKRRSTIKWVGLAVIALPTVHIVSTLLFAVLGLAPSSSRWSLSLTFAGVLAVIGFAIGLQSKLVRLQQRSKVTDTLQVLVGTVSGVASGALLGFFIGGQLGKQQTLWAVVGLAIGAVGFGSLAMWAYRKQVRNKGRRGFRFASFCCSALSLVGGLCAYGLAFGLGAWAWMAIGTGRIGLAVLLGLLTALYLWCTRQAILLLGET